MAAPLKIGAVAQRSGLTVKTIRCFREAGLIQPISRWQDCGDRKPSED